MALTIMQKVVSYFWQEKLLILKIYMTPYLRLLYFLTVE